MANATQLEMPTVLLVEDDEKESLLYQIELREEGYEIIRAVDGCEALEIVEKQRPDIVIMDISMPHMDGIDVMNRMLSRHNKLPIVINTSYASYKDDFRTWAADAYVVKSSDLTELKRAVRKILQDRGFRLPVKAS